jgi:F-type H+-transporting ATPase subunit delta
MARRTTASRRYAEAAFELALRDDTVDAWERDLATAAQLVGDERVARIVDNPSRPFAERRKVLDDLLNRRIKPEARRLVALLAERGRLDLLPEIALEYGELLKRHRGIVTAIVTSAVPLTADESRALEERLRDMTGATIELEPRIDPALIGGLTVRIGDRLLDGSVRGRLERLREQLIAGNYPRGAGAGAATGLS